jgi:methanogenic corrinoid protein MtbC1
MVELTGVTEFTLRGWEGRYGAFQPHRTSTGRRVYGRSDVLRACAMKALVERGHRISAIANLNVERLRELLADVPFAAEKAASSKQVASIIEASQRQAWARVEAEFEGCRRGKRPLEFIRSLIIPLLMEMGRQVAAGNLSIAQEHILSSFVREYLYSLKRAARKKPSKIRFVMASPEGDFHELGLLTAAAIASVSGFRVLYLGPNVPMRDLVESGTYFAATHVVLASTVSRTEGAKDDLLHVVNFLDRHLPENCEIWLGGRNCEDPSLQLGCERAVSRFASLEDFSQSILSIK